MVAHQRPHTLSDEVLDAAMKHPYLSPGAETAVILRVGGPPNITFVLADVRELAKT